MAHSSLAVPTWGESDASDIKRSCSLRDRGTWLAGWTLPNQVNRLFTLGKGWCGSSCLGIYTDSHIDTWLALFTYYSTACIAYSNLHSHCSGEIATEMLSILHYLNNAICFGEHALLIRKLLWIMYERNQWFKNCSPFNVAVISVCRWDAFEVKALFMNANEQFLAFKLKRNCAQVLSCLYSTGNHMFLSVVGHKGQHTANEHDENHSQISWKNMLTKKKKLLI